jgi:hypothetical protein
MPGGAFQRRPVKLIKPNATGAIQMLKSSKLSRRALVSGAAASVPLASAAAVATQEPTTGGDAELLALGVKLDAIISEWQAQVRKDRAETNVWEAACEATGLPRLELDEVPREEFDARCDARRDLWYPEKAEHDARTAAEHDEEGQSIVWNDIHGRLYLIFDYILSQRAQTVDGLAVQARAIVMAASDLWEDRGDDNEAHERIFIEAVCAFVGVAPEQLLLRDNDDDDAVQS